MLIMLCLTILFVITLLSILSGGSFISGTTENEIINEIVVNGTTTTLGFEATDLTFAIDPLLGGLVMLTVVIALASLIGIQFLGSGLSPASVSTIRTAIMYTGLWVTLSLVSAPLIASIEVMGSVIYITLTIVFVIGVFQRITGGGDI